MTLNKLIAVAGGIASGKSVVMKKLQDLGANVLYSDEINRELLASSEYLEKIINTFPDCAIDGILDKAKMRVKIADDSVARSTLNAIAHPLIKDKILSKANEVGGIVFVEIPLLKSAAMENIFDVVWYVRAPMESRIALLMQRDNLNETAAKAIIAMQIAEIELEKSADCIIDNDNTYNQLCEKVADLYGKII